MNFKLIIILILACISLTGNTGPVATTKITGGDELFTADVVEESGQRKLVVKSSSVPSAVGDLFFLHTEKAGSPDLTVDGSSTPVEFIIASEAKDLIVEGLAFHGFDGGIKVDNFLGLNSPLTNGILVEIKSQNEVFTFFPIKNTQDFDAHFAWGDARSFDIIFASGNDSIVARYGKTNPFIIKKTGTYTPDDYIKIVVRDNLSTVSSLRFMATGSRD